MFEKLICHLNVVCIAEQIDSYLAISMGLLETDLL